MPEKSDSLPSLLYPLAVIGVVLLAWVLSELSPTPSARSMSAGGSDELADYLPSTESRLSERGGYASSSTCRACHPAEYASWHYPDALHLEFRKAVEAHPHFERGRPYVLYCEFGLKSAHLADLMRRADLDARHVSGGLREVRRIAES